MAPHTDSPTSASESGPKKATQPLLLVSWSGAEVKVDVDVVEEVG